MTKNFLKLSKKTVDAIERKLARFITADQFLWIGKANEEELREFAAKWPKVERPLESVFVAQTQFEEPESHIRARQILGTDFHGINVVEKHLGVFTDAEREERKLLRVRDQKGEFLSEEETLALLEECKGDFVLCAMHPLDLCGIHAVQKSRFTADQEKPWFGKPAQREKFSGAENRDPWVLMRKSIVPKSNRKGIDAQKSHLLGMFPKERSVLPAEFANIAIVHFGETGEKLGGNYIIRFFVQAAEGYWVFVDWNGGQLYFFYCYGYASGSIGSLSARTSKNLED